jgi:eukaryotic-like serine/threonine-protein kinase
MMEQPIHPTAEPIPGYRLIERIGRGGYGEVWKAEAPGGIHKAIKFVSGDTDGVGEDGKAAEQEYRSLNRVKTIRHPFLLSIERFEVIHRQLIIVMELADRNLWDRYNECVRNGLPGIPRPELLRYIEEAAEALDLMNIEHQIQHLDVKPQNLFLVHQHIKVADFGLAKDLDGAKADLTGGITPTYAPPETFEGWVSRQSDQYSLAIVYMEMLTGRRPFVATNTRQMILQHMTAVPDLSPLPPAERPAVGRALSKVPDERFTTCADLVRALRGEDTPAPLRSPVPAELRTDRRRNPNDTDVPAGPTQLAPPGERRSVPALVTPSSKLSQSSSHVRRVAESVAAPASRPPAAERTGEGVLFPALIIGVGRIGLSVLRSLRQLVSDRFGKPTLPNLRWLFLDTDPAAGEAAVASPTSAALSPEDVLLTRLRRPTHYLTREGLPSVESWLPQEELFRMPKTPATEGVRGLGRLALCDHYHVVCQRVRTALEAFVSTTAIEDADRLTRLGVRSTFPRVYLATSLTGGTGSGMYLDLAYLIRRVARQMGFGTPHLVGFLGVPTFSTESRDASGLANARAALTELHHYGCAMAGYKTQFDTREGPFCDPERPFRRCVLVPLGSRFDPDGAARAAEMAAHAAMTDLLTPVGRVAHPDNGGPGESLLTLVGLRRLGWPRAPVVRAAAWQLARKTLQFWSARGSGDPMPAVSAAVDALWTERPFDRAAVRPLVEKLLTESLKAPAATVVEQLLRPLSEERSSDRSEISRARTIFTRFLDLIGRPGIAEDDNPYQLDRVLTDKVREVGVHVDKRLASVVLSLVEQPGLRLAGADEAVGLLRDRLAGELALADREAQVEEDRVFALYAPLVQLLAPGPSPSPGSQRGGQDLAAVIRQWAMARIEGLIVRACANVFRYLLGNVPDSVRELTAIRDQLRTLQAKLDSDPPTLPTSSGLLQAVFPFGAKSGADAAARLLGELSSDDLREFENGVQARIRHEFRGIASVCARAREVGSGFLNALVDQACKFLDTRAPRMNASQILAHHAANPDVLWDKVAELVSNAAPAGLGPERSATATLTVLATPPDDAAGRLAETVRHLAPNAEFRMVATTDDIVLYQESPVSLAALPHLASDLTPSPDHAERRPLTTHARTDVPWTPVGVH